jgi:hypothetical protein
MKDPKSDPRRARTGAEVDAGQADHRKRTSRFVQAHPYTREQIETAVVTATCAQLVAALDLSQGLPDSGTACDCPKCGALRSVSVIGHNHWRCETCGQLGSWLALRQSVAMSVESCIRLTERVHGFRSEAA